mgnify:CR=1 FL=1|jgi:hypothetical protein
MTQLDTRNRKPTQNIPHIKKLIEEDEKPVVVEDVKEDIVDDVIEDKKNERPEQVEEDLFDETEDSKDNDIEEDTDDADVDDVKEEQKKRISYKEKFKNSSRESLNNFFKYKKITDTIDEASNLPEPTEEELITYTRVQGAEYGELDEFTKNIVKKTYLNEQKMNRVAEVAKESKEIDKWVEHVDLFLEADETINQFPSLEDRADDFRSYCLKAGRRGMDLNDLVASYLYNLGRSNKKKSQSLFLSQGNGRNRDVKPVGMTGADLATIRTTDPKEYRRLIRTGKARLKI